MLGEQDPGISLILGPKLKSIHFLARVCSSFLFLRLQSTNGLGGEIIMGSSLLYIFQATICKKRIA